MPSIPPSEIQLYDTRNTQKKNIVSNSQQVLFKERDVFFITMGKNIHFEQNGKGTNFSRPVVIIKKFNNDVFRGVALSTKIKTGTYYYQFTINKVPQCAILSQVRLYDAKGLVRKIGMINLPDFQTLKQKIKSLL